MKSAAPELLSELSLRFVWDDRSRHGVDLIALFRQKGSIQRSMLSKIKKLRKDRRDARKEAKAAHRSGGATDVLEKRSRKTSRKFDKSVAKYLLKIQETLVRPDFRFEVLLGPTPVNSRPQTYRLQSAGYDTTYFAARILQRDISRAFGLRHVGRTEIMRTFTSALGGRWPKDVIRADVKSYYESIPHADLLALVDSNDRLSALSKQWIRDLLSSYVALGVGQNGRGLPRGVGPSAVLAEAYLSGFDKSLGNRKECVFYARYVDDIVAVMAPTEDHDAPAGGYLGLLRTELAGLKLELATDPRKVSEVALRKDVGPTFMTITMLGYEIKHDITTGLVSVDFAQKRLTRISKRIERSFEIYERSKSREGLSAKMLEMRIRFLTSNTRLVNSKKDAFVGIRFSNPLLTSKGGLRTLDRVLKRRLARLAVQGAPAGLISRLEKHGFQIGFDQVKYVQFTDNELRQLTSAWRDLV